MCCPQWIACLPGKHLSFYRMAVDRAASLTSVLEKCVVIFYFSPEGFLFYFIYLFIFKEYLFVAGISY